MNSKVGESDSQDLRQEAACILASMTTAGSKNTDALRITVNQNKDEGEKKIPTDGPSRPSQDLKTCIWDQPTKSTEKEVFTNLSKKSRNSGNGFAKTFPEKLMEILEYCSSEDKKICENQHNECACWLPHGNSFLIKNMVVLSLEILPMFFSNKNSTETIAARAHADQNSQRVKAIAEQKFKSFTRKLYRWGFRQVTRGPDTGSYMHPLFKRHKKEDCLRMKCHYSTRELKTQRENAARAEERRKMLCYSKDKKGDRKFQLSNAISEKEGSYLESGSKKSLDDFNRTCSQAMIPIQECNILGNKVRNSDAICTEGPNSVKDLMNSGNIISCKSGISRHMPMHASRFEDASRALADAVFRNKNIDTVFNSQHEISLRKRQAAFLEQRAQSHFVAAAAAAAAASRLAQPNQLILPGGIVNPRFEMNMYTPVNAGHSTGVLNNENMNMVMEPRRRGICDLEKQIMLSDAFKQEYDDQLEITALLRQRLQGQAQSMQQTARNMDFYCNRLRGPRFQSYPDQGISRFY